MSSNLTLEPAIIGEKTQENQGIQANAQYPYQLPLLLHTQFQRIRHGMLRKIFSAPSLKPLIILSMPISPIIAVNEVSKLNFQVKKCLESLFAEENERLRRLSTNKCPKSIEGIVYIPETAFIMGSYEYNHEKPIRKVKVNTFYIDRYPVTNAQYKEFVDATKHPAPKHWEGGKIPAGKENHPVVCVSWHDAKAYCEWKSKVTGVKVRLPKEEEWELAGRGILGRRWPWGNEFDPEKCNAQESGVGNTTPVGKYEEGKSPYGCYDMAGNVWEWTDSWYDSSDCFVRGGAWCCSADGCRVADRDGDNPEFSDLDVGFRCCQDFLKELPLVPLLLSSRSQAPAWEREEDEAEDWERRDCDGAWEQEGEINLRLTPMLV